MKIWKLDAVGEKYDYLIPANGYDIEEIYTYDGRSHKDEWNGRKVIPDVVRKKPNLGDITECLGIPVFSKNAIEKLYDLIKDDVEFLPLDCDEGDFSMINVTTVLDAIDYEKSDFERFKSSGRIMYFEKYVFREDVVKGHNIFKIVDENLNPVFVSDDFVKAVRKNRLKGFRFAFKWDSEAPLEDNDK